VRNLRHRLGCRPSPNDRAGTAYLGRLSDGFKALLWANILFVISPDRSRRTGYVLSPRTDSTLVGASSQPWRDPRRWLASRAQKGLCAPDQAS
jgi:hypothetical protein